jgi:hypothetical protein
MEGMFSKLTLSENTVFSISSHQICCNAYLPKAVSGENLWAFLNALDIVFCWYKNKYSYCLPYDIPEQL